MVAKLPPQACFHMCGMWTEDSPVKTLSEGPVQPLPQTALLWEAPPEFGVSFLSLSFLSLEVQPAGRGTCVCVAVQT